MIKSLKSLLILMAAAGSISGCASVSKYFEAERGSKSFVLERSWARHTGHSDEQHPYMGFRINHVMEPVLFSNLVIQGNELDGLTAYDQETGREKWRRSITGGVTAGAREKSGILYFGAGDGFFYAVDANTGATRWSFPLRAEGLGAPLVTADAVYFLSGNNSAYALKAATGEQIWFYNRIDSANLTMRGASEPTLVGNRLYLGFSDGFLVALDKDKGTLIWEKQLGLTPRFRDVDSKPVLDGERLYVSSYDGQLYCLNASSGQVLWQNDEGGFTPVTIVGDTLYYSTSSRKVIALEKSSGRELWVRELKSTVAGTPIVHRGLVIFGEWSGALRALDISNGRDVTQFATGRGVTSKPVLDAKNDRIFVMTADANLFAVDLQLKNLAQMWPWD